MNSNKKSDHEGQTAKQTRPRSPGSLVWLLILIAAVVYFYTSDNTDSVSLTYSEFIERVKNNNVKKVVFKNNHLHGTLKTVPDSGNNADQQSKNFVTTKLPVQDSQLLNLLRLNEVEIDAEPGDSGWVNMLAGCQKKSKVDMEDFILARDKILLGNEREDFLSDSEKELIAYHESGHALLAKLMPETDPLQKVTIIPRGRTMGATEVVPQIDRHNFQSKYLSNRITVMLGGRAAEKLKFNDVSNGAENDLKQATK